MERVIVELAEVELMNLSRLRVSRAGWRRSPRKNRRRYGHVSDGFAMAASQSRSAEGSRQRQDHHRILTACRPVLVISQLSRFPCVGSVFFCVDATAPHPPARTYPLRVRRTAGVDRIERGNLNSGGFGTPFLDAHVTEQPPRLSCVILARSPWPHRCRRTWFEGVLSRTRGVSARRDAQT